VPELGIVFHPDGQIVCVSVVLYCVLVAVAVVVVDKPSHEDFNWICLDWIVHGVEGCFVKNVEVCAAVKIPYRGRPVAALACTINGIVGTVLIVALQDSLMLLWRR
jgi:hypothetical protein